MTEPPQRSSARHTRAMAIGMALAIVASAVILVTLNLRHRHRLRVEADRRARQAEKGPQVYVTPARTLPGDRELTLPAEVRAFKQSTVYAKVSGYVTEIHVDKGDPVRKGQLLGSLESPELDQQVAAARSDTVIRRRTFERYGQLVSRDYVSRQDYETMRAQYEVSRATLGQALAQQAYKQLRAPFDGVVTARYVDPGALVSAATGGTGSALPLVDVADPRRLRVTVFVEQDAAPFVSVGDPVVIVDYQRPELKIAGQVSRFSQALDPRSAPCYARSGSTTGTSFTRARSCR